MKILVVSPQPFYMERGTPMAVRLLVETLCDFGHEVDLLVYHEGSDVAIPSMRLVRARRPPGVRHVPIGISWQKLACDVFLIVRMVGLLLRNRYDVVHAVEEAVFPAAVLNLFSRRKLVYDMDSWMSQQMTDKWVMLRPLRPFLAGIERMAVRRSAVVLPVCEDLAEVVRSWVDRERVIVLPDVPVGDENRGVAGESLRALAGPNSVIALYVGNLEAYQGIDLLVDAVARLPCELDVQTVVIGGSESDVNRYREMAQKSGLAGRLHFMGPRPVADLNAYLEQADVLVSPRTLGQNTPMKVYSYMQSGKAILATDIRSHTQVLDRGCAELVEPQAAALSSGLVRLARDGTLRRRLGEEARARAERDYSRTAYRERLRRAYGQLAAG